MSVGSSLARLAYGSARDIRDARRGRHPVLPFSRIEGEISTVRWNLSQNLFDGRREMSPDVPVQLTAGAYFAGRDPALEAVFRSIQESRAKR